MPLVPRLAHRIVAGVVCLVGVGMAVFYSRSDLSSLPAQDRVAASKDAQVLSCSTARRWFQLESGTEQTLRSVVGNELGTV
jgi:hypothetical protein